VLFAWRLFRDRLPTKDNLLRRGVIDQASRTCVAGCYVPDHFNQFSYSGGIAKVRCSIFQVIWFATV